MMEDKSYLFLEMLGKHDDCAHERKVICVRDHKSTRSFRVQCLRCGRCSQAIPRISLEQLRIDVRTLPEYNQKLLDDFFKEKERLLLENQERENREWWRRYNKYLESDEWKKIRRLVMLRSKGMCEGCGVRTAEQVHHLTYDRVFREMLFDLVAVCIKCHEAIHADE